jgi:hypothetical protein
MLAEVTRRILPNLSAADAPRAMRALDKLRRHQIGGWALTGGLAFEMHGMHLGLGAATRALNDLDFVADAFEHLPQTLAPEFWFRHIHPQAAPGKTMAQLIDPDNALRIDVFRTQGATLDRTVRMGPRRDLLPVVSLEDLIARAARLLLDLAEGIPVGRKYAHDYVRFVECVHPDRVEAAWRDHRKPEHPMAFPETKVVLRDLLPASTHLLIVGRYSQNPDEPCPLCAITDAFPLADPKAVLSVLGYC